MSTKTINLTLNTKDFLRLNKVKKASGKTWEAFVMTLVEQKKEVKDEINKRN